MKSKNKENLLFNCDILSVGVDYYCLYKWPEKERTQTIVNGEIKYFRIGLSYKTKYFEKETNLKNICKIDIYYIKVEDIKNGIKKLTKLGIDILEFYNYLIKYYEEDDVITYIQKFCKKFYVPEKVNTSKCNLISYNSVNEQYKYILLNKIYDYIAEYKFNRFIISLKKLYDSNISENINKIESCKNIKEKQINYYKHVFILENNIVTILFYIYYKNTGSNIITRLCGDCNFINKIKNIDEENIFGNIRPNIPILYNKVYLFLYVPINILTVLYHIKSILLIMYKINNNYILINYKTNNQTINMIDLYKNCLITNSMKLHYNKIQKLKNFNHNLASLYNKNNYQIPPDRSKNKLIKYFINIHIYDNFYKIYLLIYYHCLIHRNTNLHDIPIPVYLLFIYKLDKYFIDCFMSNNNNFKLCNLNVIKFFGVKS